MISLRISLSAASLIFSVSACAAIDDVRMSGSMQKLYVCDIAKSPDNYFQKEIILTTVLGSTLREGYYMSDTSCPQANIKVIFGDKSQDPKYKEFTDKILRDQYHNNGGYYLLTSVGHLEKRYSERFSKTINTFVIDKVKTFSRGKKTWGSK